jgi:hypothetical protein
MHDRVGWLGRRLVHLVVSAVMDLGHAEVGLPPRKLARAGPPVGGGESSELGHHVRPAVGIRRRHIGAAVLQAVRRPVGKCVAVDAQDVRRALVPREVVHALAGAGGAVPCAMGLVLADRDLEHSVGAVPVLPPAPSLLVPLAAALSAATSPHTAATVRDAAVG